MIIIGLKKENHFGFTFKGFLLTGFFWFSFSQADCTLSTKIKDTVGPATYDYFQRAQIRARKKKCQSILVRINTPGGSLQSTRKIVELIMTSPVPYLCLIHPSGGHAGSAGAIIMQACHVNGAVEATNIGAATPISGSGQEIPDDLKKKLFEDTKSWVESLAKYHGRSVEFARDIVLKAKALDAREAFKQKAIDVVVSDINGFLNFSESRTVRLKSRKNVPVSVGPLELFEPGLRHDIVQIFSNPQWVYLIFMGSLGLLYFEMTHPGSILPGVVGALGLVISLINFHILGVSWGAVFLIFLGVGFLFAEIFVPSFGALGLGGLASFIVGSLLLFDGNSDYTLPLSVVIATSIVLALIMFGVGLLAVQATRRGILNREREKMEGKEVSVRHFNPRKKKGIGLYHGELWKIQSDDYLNEEDVVIVKEVKGFTLVVCKRR